ncbi:MAG: hypothetical protein ACOCVM_07865 [Desulfovibrionaceae bacterium]
MMSAIALGSLAPARAKRGTSHAPAGLTDPFSGGLRPKAATKTLRKPRARPSWPELLSRVR